MALEDLTNQTFGRLYVDRRGPNAPSGIVQWRCICSCGLRKLVPAVMLKHGKTKSCGCLRREVAADNGRASTTTHGHRAGKTSAEYKAWRSMKDRCSNPNSPNYADYGGRGIKVCVRWLESFENFLADVGPRPAAPAGSTKKRPYSLDRMKNENGYEPGNVRWATMKEQQRNRRSNHLLTHEGRTQTVTAWAEEVGMSKVTLRWRVAHDWPLNLALVPPAKLTR